MNLVGESLKNCQEMFGSYFTVEKKIFCLFFLFFQEWNMSQTILSQIHHLLLILSDWTKCLTQKCVFCSTCYFKQNCKNYDFGMYFKKCKVCKAENTFRFSAWIAKQSYGVCWAAQAEQSRNVIYRLSNTVLCISFFSPLNWKCAHLYPYEWHCIWSKQKLCGWFVMHPVIYRWRGLHFGVPHSLCVSQWPKMPLFKCWRHNVSQHLQAEILQIISSLAHPILWGHLLALTNWCWWRYNFQTSFMILLCHILSLLFFL